MICHVCGSPFIGRRDRRWCSLACKRVLQSQYPSRYIPAPKVIRTCAICGTHFEGSLRNLYCSPRCKQLRHQQANQRSRRDHPDQWREWHRRARRKLDPEKERERHRRQRQQHPEQQLVQRRKAKVARTLAKTQVALNSYKTIIGTPKPVKPWKSPDPIRRMWTDLFEHCPETYRLLRSWRYRERFRRQYYTNLEESRRKERERKRKWREKTGRTSQYYRKRARSVASLSNPKPAK